MMRFRFPAFKPRCPLERASKPANQIPSRPFTAHTSQPLADDSCSSYGENFDHDERIINLLNPKLLDRLWQLEIVQIPYIVNKIVSICANSSLLHMGIQLHATIFKMGFHSNVYISTAFVDMYGKCGVISSAKQLFDEMPQRNVVTWNSLMSAYLHNENPQNAIALFFTMLRWKMNLTPISVSIVLVSCGQLEAVELGGQIHGYSVKTEFRSNVVVGTGLIDMYGKCSAVECARTVFDEMWGRNVVTWTSMVTGYARNSQPLEALDLVREMLRSGLTPTYVTYTSLLSSFCYPDDFDYCKQIQSRIIREGLESNSYLAATLLTAYSECSCSVKDFHKLCSKLEIWDQVLWSAVIAGWSNLEKGHDALSCFLEMRRAGFTVDYYAFTSILRAAGIVSALEVGKQVHSLVFKSGYAHNLYVQNGLVSMYARCGKISDSGKVFSKMDQHDLISWNSLLSGLAHHGNGREVVEMFEWMRNTEVKPDLTTFLAVLSACSHVGLLNKGLEYFDLMKADFSLNPKMEHYACVVDLYGRAGLLNEAEAFVHSMPIVAGPSVFKALISACQVHGNTEIAVRSARKLVALYPNDPATYVLLSNVLAVGGNWDNAAGVRVLMCSRGLEKDPGSSWISS